MNLTCNLYVDGEFEGVINSQKDVNIGKQGHIKGEIVTQRLVVQGYVEGTVNAQRVEIKAGGKLNGTVESTELVIEAKGIFEGTSVVKNLDTLPVKS
jgi:cytoskeletal protein CcmA (bactofilin family)